jgi:DNA-binding XRE family transcriptional regulator
MSITSIPTGARLRAARALAGFTRDDLAFRIGVSRDCLRAWEHSSDALPSAQLRPFVRLVQELEDAGVEFRDDGSLFYARATPLNRATVVHSESPVAS